MANGKVCTGFSFPHVATYSAAGGNITFSGGRPLARGVNVQIAPNSSGDNKFYADNVEAESAGGVFTGGTLTATVDGLFRAAKRFIYGLPAPDSNGWLHYGDNQRTPNVAFGYITRWMSGGVTTYQPTILVKTKFNIPEESAATQEEEIEWQTQELTASIMRGENANHDWKLEGDDYLTEQEAKTALQTALGMNLTLPTVSAVPGSSVLFEHPVSEMQSDVQLSGLNIYGTLNFIEGGLAETGPLSGDGYFLALQFSNLDSRATSVKVGLDPSEGTGLVEIIDDPDKNGVFKISNTAQVFVIQVSDGNTTISERYSLTQLNLTGAGA